MVTHIQDNIFQICVELPNSPLKSLNAYLIKGDGRNLLVDTGFRTEVCRRDLLEGLKELGVSMEDTDIFLTHLHADHSGLAVSIASKTTKIYLSSEDAARLIKMNSEDGWQETEQWYEENGFSTEQIHQAKRAPMYHYRCEPFEGFTRIQAGETLRYGGHQLQTIATPGHTPGHMCLYDTKCQAMFLGDHVLFDITPNIISWPNFADPLGTYLENLSCIEKYQIRLPLPGHRGVHGTLQERINDLKKHHEERLREMNRVLQENPKATAYQLAAKMTWHVKGCMNGWESYPISQKRFAVGETVAHLQYLEKRGFASSCKSGQTFLYYSIQSL